MLNYRSRIDPFVGPPKLVVENVPHFAYAIHWNTNKYPDKFIVQPLVSDCSWPTQMEAVRVCDTLEQARQLVPLDRRMIERSSTDDPTLLETWV